MKNVYELLEMEIEMIDGIAVLKGDAGSIQCRIGLMTGRRDLNNFLNNTGDASKLLVQWAQDGIKDCDYTDKCIAIGK